MFVWKVKNKIIRHVIGSPHNLGKCCVYRIINKTQPTQPILIKLLNNDQPI